MAYGASDISLAFSPTPNHTSAGPVIASVASPAPAAAVVSSVSARVTLTIDVASPTSLAPGVQPPAPAVLYSAVAVSPAIETVQPCGWLGSAPDLLTILEALRPMTWAAAQQSSAELTAVCSAHAPPYATNELLSSFVADPAGEPAG